MSEHLVVTWPKSRPLGSYIAELVLAKRDDLLINYRIQHPPHVKPRTIWKPDDDSRVYRVHDGQVRGYTPLRSVTYHGSDRVRIDRHSGAFWAAGWFLTCEPTFVAITPIPMKGFRGWRWFEQDSL